MDKPIEMGGVIVDASVKARVVVTKGSTSLARPVNKGRVFDVWIEACHQAYEEDAPRVERWVRVRGLPVRLVLSGNRRNIPTLTAGATVNLHDGNPLHSVKVSVIKILEDAP